MGIPAQAFTGANLTPLPLDQATAVLSGSFAGVGVSPPGSFWGPINLALWASSTTSLTTTAGSASATLGSATGLAAGASIKSTLVPPGTTIGALAGTDATLAFPTLCMPGIVGVGGNLMSGVPSTQWLLGATVSGPGIPSGTTVLSIVQPSLAPNINQAGKPGIIELSNSPTSAPNSTNPQLFSFAIDAAGSIAAGVDNNASFTGAGVVWVGTVQVERSFDGGYTWLVCNVGGSGQLAQYNAGTPVNLCLAESEKGVLYRLNAIAYSSGLINYRLSSTGPANLSIAVGGSLS